MMYDNSAFEIVRESVTAEQAAIMYGAEVNRQHRAKCPFHNGQDYNLSFHKGGFNCFVCGEKGDAIGFTQKLFGYIKPIDALKRLNNDFRLGLELNTDTPSKIDYGALKNIRKKAAERDLPECVRNILWEYVLNLEWIKRELAPKTPDDEHPDIWVYALHNADYAQYMLDCYDCETDAEKLKYITENRKAVGEYEKFNRVVDGLLRKRNTA
jgi:hypothetical protein